MLKPKKKSNKGKFILLGVLIFFMLVVIGAASDDTSNTGQDSKNSEAKTEEKKPEPPKPTYEASLGEYWAQDPATLIVTVHVKNTSQVEGSPSCFVSASNPSSVYTGYDTFAGLKTLAPGEEWNFNARLTITKEGAAYVSQGSVECS